MFVGLSCKIRNHGQHFATRIPLPRQIHTTRQLGARQHCRKIMANNEKLFKRRRMQGPASPIHALVDHPETILQHTTGNSFKVPGLIVTDHFFKVPLDHTGEVQGDIDLFCREVVAPNQVRRTLPYLLYLQGGPGFESPRPTEASAWLKSAVNSFRVVLMDQRGTGKSSQISCKNLAKAGTPEEQAAYLALFRADSIVRDAEYVRKALVPRENNAGRWSILGQSFGGFCCHTYLSLAPEGLIEVMMTGGIPPNITDGSVAEKTYRALMPRVILQNRKYYTRFPDDVKLVQDIVLFLDSQAGGGYTLPSGTVLRARTLQMLGMFGLGTGGGFERLHYLLETFFDDEGDISPSFIKSFESWMPWDTNPLYALVHESIYCQHSASNWAAERVRTTEYGEQMDASTAAKEGRQVLFTGEMVFPWMFEDFVALRPYKAVADLLAAKADWPELYNPAGMAKNEVPVVAATYVEDMYVDYQLAQQTAACVKGLRQWTTNEYKHSGIRDDGSRIFDRLLNMARDTILLD